MEHRIEVSPSGRASCKTCGKAIAKGELRLGEEYASQFGSDGVAIRWHHLACAAGKIPDVLREAMERFTGDIPERETLEATMRGEAKSSSEGGGAAPKKTGAGGLPNADLAPTGRAKCIQCSEAIAKGAVRISVEREVDTGSFTTKGAGYLHPACAETWAAGEWAAGFADFVERVKTNTSLDALPPPFGDGSTPTAAAEPVASAKKAKAAKAPKADAPAEAPAFGEMTGKSVAAIVAKLAKIKEEYKSDSVFEKAGIDWAQRDPLRWHIAKHGLLPATHPTILYRMSESAAYVTADDVFAVIGRLREPAKDYVEIIPGWTTCEDLIVLRAHALDPARLEAMLETAPPRVRTGIQLVRGRHGITLPERDRAELLAAIARTEATSYGLPRSHSAAGPRLNIGVLAADGTRTEPFTNAIDLARRFGTDGQWFDALAQATRAAKFSTLEHVMDGLVRLPLGEMVTMLAGMHFSTGEQHDRQFATLVERRAETPAALVAAALSIAKDAYPGKYVREPLLLHALAAMGKQGLAVPDGLEKEPQWDTLTYSMPPWRGSAPARDLSVAALRALPADRALAMVKPIVERGWALSMALPFLAVHHDDALLRRVIAGSDGVNDGALFATFGARAFEPLRDALATLGTTPEDEKRRKLIGGCIQAAMAFEGLSGRSFDASLDAFASCDPAEAYWSEERRKQLEAILNAMPEPRRIATIDRLFDETKQVERPFFCAHTVADGAYRAKAARRLVQNYANVMDRGTLQLGLKALGPNGLDSFRAALLEGTPDTKIFTELKYVFGDGPVNEVMKTGHIVEEKSFARMMRLARERITAGAKSTRIYLLERRDLDASAPAPRGGSFSFSRGKGPAIDRAALGVPSEHEHIVTIDLEEVPELAGGRSGARAIALYAADPNLGDAWDGSRLVDVPIGATAPADGTPLSVFPLDVPNDIFDTKLTATDPVLKELRGLVFNRPGYALGEPMFIQDDIDDIGFVMQLGEQIGDLNLGDSGSLYVFDGASYMQCF